MWKERKFSSVNLQNIFTFHRFSHFSAPERAAACPGIFRARLGTPVEGAGVHFTVTQEAEPAANSPPDLNNNSFPLLQVDSLPEGKALSFHLEEVPTGFLVRLELILCKEGSINSLLEAPSALREEGLTIFQVVQTSIL